MPEPVKVNVVSYGGVKPGQLIVGNTKEGEKTTLFDAATDVDGTYAFYGKGTLTSWDVALPNLTDGTHMFFRTGLTSLDIDLPNLTNGTNMFNGSRLSSWDIDLPNLTDGTNMFYTCSSLTSFSSTLPNLTNGNGMFAYSRLTSFSSTLPNLTNGTNMFTDCKLSAESVKQILNSIPDRASAGLSVAKLAIGKRTNFMTDPDVKELLGETGAEITAKTYSFKGWDVTVQN